MKCRMCGDGFYNPFLGMCLDCGYIPSKAEPDEWKERYSEDEVLEDEE